MNKHVHDPLKGGDIFDYSELANMFTANGIKDSPPCERRKLVNDSLAVDIKTTERKSVNEYKKKIGSNF